MSKICLVLLLCCASLSAFASELLWLEKQLKNFGGDATFIQSYEDREQSYVYDQALAVIAFSRAGEFKKASKLIRALKKTQLDDGSWYFSYYLDGTSPHPQEGDMRPSGSIAWVTLAILTYQKLSEDTQFESVWLRALKHLRLNIQYHDKLRSFALRFSSVDNSKTPYNERNISSLEHTVDTISALKLAYELKQEASWLNDQIQLQDFALKMWDAEAGHFWSGADLKKGEVNKSEFYLDNQSWTALALKHLGLETQFKSALLASCKLQVKDDEKVGFTESQHMLMKAKFIWSEGTAGKALALESFKTSCPGTKISSYAQTLEIMKVDGGVRYADRENIPHFSYSPSVAGTVWTWFLKNKINPFDV